MKASRIASNADYRTARPAPLTSPWLKALPRSLLRSMALAALLGTTLSGCGGGSEGGASCGAGSACGGNLEGTWTITSSCITGSFTTQLSDTCSVSGKITNATMNGTLTFNADNTYTNQVTVGGEVSLMVPTTCLVIYGITATCDQFTQAAKLGELKLPPMTCVTATGGCACSITQQDQQRTMSGTYATEGTQLTLNDSQTSSTPSSSAYCAKDNQLTLTPSLDSLIPEGSTATFDGFLVARK